MTQKDFREKKGADSLLHYVLRRLDRDAPPIYLKDSERRAFWDAEVELLVRCGVLTKRAEIKWVANPQDESDRRPLSKRFVEVSVVGLAAILRSQNGIEGTLCEHSDRLITLGHKTADGIGEVAIYLAVRNGDDSGFVRICERVTDARNPKPSAVIVPQPVPLTREDQEFLKLRKLVVVPLLTNMLSHVWVLDWKKLLEPLTPPTLRLVSSTEQVFYKSQEVTLTPTPFRFFKEIAESVPDPISRETLIEKVIPQKQATVDPVPWARDQKAQIVQAFVKSGIPRDEVRSLILVRSGRYRLDLHPNQVEIR